MHRRSVSISEPHRALKHEFHLHYPENVTQTPTQPSLDSLVFLYSSTVTDPASEEKNLKAAPFTFTIDRNVGTFFPTRFVLICRIQQV